MMLGGGSFSQIQLEALAIRYFIIKYDEFERKVKEIFSNNISKISSENKQMLYFFLAGIKCSARINYIAKSLKIDEAKYLANEQFKQFSFSQIIKIQRQNHILELFDFNIPSINSKTTEYTFLDCCIKLLNMRNKLAHEMARLSFVDKDVIELFSDEYIKKNSSSWFFTIDTELMNHETKCIFSNLLMLEQIEQLLIEREANYEY